MDGLFSLRSGEESPVTRFVKRLRRRLIALGPLVSSPRYAPWRQESEAQAESLSTPNEVNAPTPPGAAASEKPLTLLRRWAYKPPPATGEAFRELQPACC